MTTHVLVIDDDPAITDLLVLLLNSYGMKVTVVNSGADGLEMVHEHKPDIILLDLMMQEMSGWQFCVKLRKFSDIPIMIHSALDSPDMIASALDAGANDYMIKPVQGKVLADRLKSMVRKAARKKRVQSARSLTKKNPDK